MLRKLVVAMVLASLTAATALDSLVAVSLAPVLSLKISKKMAMKGLLQLRQPRSGSLQQETAGPWLPKAPLAHWSRESGSMPGSTLPTKPRLSFQRGCSGLLVRWT